MLLELLILLALLVAVPAIVAQAIDTDGSDEQR